MFNVTGAECNGAAHHARFNQIWQKITGSIVLNGILMAYLSQPEVSKALQVGVVSQISAKAARLATPVA
jgi:hypothetical protein